MILDLDYITMPPIKTDRRGAKRSGASDAEDDDEDYRKRRDRNNEAVKKSRFKSKQRTQETFTRVNKLKEENQKLEEKVKTLTKQLQFLKDLFLAQAADKQNPKFDGVDFEKLLKESDDENEE